MSKDFESFNKVLRDFGISIAATIVGAIIPWIFLARFRLVILIFGILLVVGFLFYNILLVRYKRLLKLIKAGATGYYYSFDPSENYKVFAEAQRSFCYLGISSHSIIEFFEHWISNNPLIGTYSFLLMDPESPALKRQVAYENGVSIDDDLSSLNDFKVKTIEQAIEIEKKRIYGTIEALKGLTPFKEGKLSIRLHNEFIPWWIYIIDGKRIYLGILEKGKRGQLSPVMILSKLSDFPSPFDPFKNIWDKMWAEAKES